MSTSLLAAAAAVEANEVKFNFTSFFLILLLAATEKLISTYTHTKLNFYCSTQFSITCSLFPCSLEQIQFLSHKFSSLYCNEPANVDLNLSIVTHRLLSSTTIYILSVLFTVSSRSSSPHRYTFDSQFNLFSFFLFSRALYGSR